MTEVTYTKTGLKKRSKKFKIEPHVTTIISIGQKLILEGYVAYDWILSHDIEEGRYLIKFLFHEINPKSNQKKSCYIIQKNTNGTAVLVRVPK